MWIWYETCVTAGGGRPPDSSLHPNPEPWEEEEEKQEVKKNKLRSSNLSVFVDSGVQEKRSGSVSHHHPWPWKPGSVHRFTVQLCGAQRLVVVGLQSQFEVGTKQLLIERREVCSDNVGINCSECWQLLCVTTAQWTQRWHLTSELRRGGEERRREERRGGEERRRGEKWREERRLTFYTHIQLYICY